MENRTLGLILQIPLILVMLASFIASIYAAATGLGGVTAATPIILGLVIIIYFIGRRLEKMSTHHY